MEPNRSSGRQSAKTAAQNGAWAVDPLVRFLNEATRPGILIVADHTLPDHLADELGVQPALDVPSVSLGLGDGRTARARVARIPSLRVGSIADEGVACLVLPPGSGDGPPVLGATFLNRVVAELDGESGTLTLTRVSPPPTATPDKPASKPKGKPS